MPIHIHAPTLPQLQIGWRILLEYKSVVSYIHAITSHLDGSFMGIESIIGPLLGLGSSLVAEVVAYFKKSQENDHELKLFERQANLVAIEHRYKLEEESVTANIEETRTVYGYLTAPTGTWVDAFASSVRPTITYTYFAAYLLIKMGVFWLAWVDHGIAASNALLQLWTPEDMIVFSTILAFWFGNRSLRGRTAIGR